jgi:hypothetical protein
VLLAFLPLKFTQPNPEVLDQVLPLDGASTLGAQCCDCDCHVCVGTGGNCPCLHHLEIHLAKYRGARQSVTRACLNLSCCTVAVVSHVSCLWLGSHWFTLVLVPKNQKFLGCNRGILHQAHVPSNFGKCLYPKRSEVSKSS